MNDKQFLVSKLTESEKWAILTWAEDHIDKDVAVRLWRDQSRGGLLMAEVRPRDGGAGRESWLIDKAANRGFEWGRESVNESLAVKLTYFKQRGKFYEEGEFRVHRSVSLLQIWDDVIQRRDNGSLPGLIEGAGKEFIILVNVPGHDHEHPRLIMPDANH